MALWHLYLLLFTFSGANGAIFTLQNKCMTTIWPGIQPNAGIPQLMNGGLELKSNQMVHINAPNGWSGRIWGRHGCVFDNSGRGNCATGDCSGLLECAGTGGMPPASLAEFTLDSPMDFYDVSLVDGYNMQVSITPLGGSGQCKSIRCLSDLNLKCPANLEVRENGVVVACKSACTAFNKPEYCCTGTYNSPGVCKPSRYAQVFKECCPTAYSYAYDDSTSIFTCKGANYLITFC